MDELAGFTEEDRKLALDPFRLLQPHGCNPSEGQSFGKVGIELLLWDFDFAGGNSLRQRFENPGVAEESRKTTAHLVHGLSL